MATNGKMTTTTADDLARQLQVSRAAREAADRIVADHAKELAALKVRFDELQAMLTVVCRVSTETIAAKDARIAALEAQVERSVADHAATADELERYRQADRDAEADRITAAIEAEEAATILGLNGKLTEEDRQLIDDITRPKDAAPSPAPDKDDLQDFSGGDDDRYQHWTGRVVFTPGVKRMADRVGAHWLIDTIASHQTKRVRQACEGLQFWRLHVDTVNKTGVLYCRKDSGLPPVVTQRLEYTDFPFDSFDLWVEGNTVLLPSEH